MKGDMNVNMSHILCYRCPFRSGIPLCRAGDHLLLAMPFLGTHACMHA